MSFFQTAKIYFLWLRITGSIIRKPMKVKDKEGQCAIKSRLEEFRKDGWSKNRNNLKAERCIINYLQILEQF